MSKFSVNSILQASNAIIVNPSKSLKDFGIDYFILSASAYSGGYPFSISGDIRSLPS